MGKTHGPRTIIPEHEASLISEIVRVIGDSITLDTDDESRKSLLEFGRLAQWHYSTHLLAAARAPKPNITLINGGKPDEPA
jgi:hypothetical protein